MSKDLKEPNYWTSLEDYHKIASAQNGEFQEFPEGISESLELSSMTDVSRRKFLALLGASAALAGTGCSNYIDPGKIIPYNKKPESVLPGRANYYATTIVEGNEAFSVLVKTREGRPIKVDGNPDDPINKGKSNAACQASLLNLYNPERLKSPLQLVEKSQKEITWDLANKEVLDALYKAKKSGKQIAVVANSIKSPTFARLLSDFRTKFGDVRTYSYDFFNDDAKVNAWKKSYNQSEMPIFDWSKPEIFLSFDGDFLGRGSNKVQRSGQYVKTRAAIDKKTSSRTYLAEAGMSITGMNADYRLKVSPIDQLEFALCIASELVLRKSVSNYSKYGSVSQLLSKHSLTSFVKKTGLSTTVISHLVDDLVQNKGKVLVYAGEQLPEDVHVVVNFLNEVLEADKMYADDYFVEQVPRATVKNLESLVADMNSGRVGVVLHLDSNPVFHFDATLSYTKALKQVDKVITFASSLSETSIISNIVLPMTHDFESWGDVNSRVGILSLQQPLIAPLYENNRQIQDVVLGWIDGTYKAQSYYSYLKSNWQKSYFKVSKDIKTFDQFWNKSLHDGVVSISQNFKRNLSFNASSLNTISDDFKVADGYVLEIQENYTIGDGRNANNGWLQEVPHPVTRVVWDNYAAISKNTADKLKVEPNQMIKLTVDSQSVVVPIFVQPGMVDGVIEITGGYGRKHAGTVGTGAGFDVHPLMSLKSKYGTFVHGGVQIVKSHGTYDVISTQEHFSFKEDIPEILKSRMKDAHLRREIIQEGTLDGYLKDEKFLVDRQAHKRKALISLYEEEHKYNGVKWGMAIDLNKCSGCNECVVACNAENNIPVVGKEQVALNREMHWLRIDRYYSGTIDEPVVSLQPMLCQHCDNAPCENVCPVSATTHTPDGLNGMAYNRCVGTRYCGNNCVYKVRRFNYFNYRANYEEGYFQKESFHLAHNPEVTVRSRGVMEKCTFCVQRISESRAEAKRNDEMFDGSKVTVACQDVCNTNAIAFGNVNDEKSEVAKMRAHELEYKVLEELHVKPNVSYLAKLRNTHKEA
ncbi:MAG: molybdopterin oxidoreductase [Candidatus Cloacimonadota bacterium]|nr:MAG: molybdopterin oxidoreductase [Candidatus Cloacimonadota bacterium]